MDTGERPHDERVIPSQTVATKVGAEVGQPLEETTGQPRDRIGASDRKLAARAWRNALFEIPTLGPGAMASLVALLAGIGLLVLRRLSM